MAIQKTRWHPDTCNCIIDYEWNDSVPQDQRVHSVKTIVSACPIHAIHPDKESHFDDVLNENQSKNKAVTLLCQSFAKLKDKEQEVVWSMDTDRSIIIDHPDLTKIDKDSFALVDKSDIKKKVTLKPNV